MPTPNAMPTLQHPQTVPVPVPVPTRRNGAAHSRAAIVAAATRLFATEGYVATGMRDVAAAAGVSSALVVRYFGSKIDLFECVLGGLLDARPLFDVARAGFGRHAVELLAGTDSASPFAMMLLASADPQARAVSTGLLDARVLEPLAAWLGADGAMRAARIAILWSGFLNCSQLLPQPVFATDRLAAILTWTADATQRIVDERPAPAACGVGGH